VTFSLEIMGDNLDHAEKGLIFIAFDLISQGFGSLGGNVSRGTGRIKIAVTEIEILNTRKFFEQYRQDKIKAGPEKITGSAFEKYKEEMIGAFFKKFNPEVSHV
jgi:CRISPR/Cas system CSM-associated protein Csm3 (group 7 of RAMP superfamily)